MAITYSPASAEPLDVIRANECESDPSSLATQRFRALWNEIERLRVECFEWKHHAGQRLIALRETEAELRMALESK